MDVLYFSVGAVFALLGVLVGHSISLAVRNKEPEKRSRNNSYNTTKVSLEQDGKKIDYTKSSDISL